MTTWEIIQKTKAAWGSVRDADGETKNRLLAAMADALEDGAPERIRLIKY